MKAGVWKLQGIGRESEKGTKLNINEKVELDKSN
jgi:hypothetical protein